MKQYYAKIYSSLLIVLFLSFSVTAQKSEKLWTKTTVEGISKTQQVIRNSEPSKAIFYQLDIYGLKNILQNAPKRKGFNGVSNVIASFPTEDGSFEAFRINEASTMSLELQAKFPEIRSYIGQGIDNPTAIIRFSLSPEKGLSSMVLSDKKTVFIEPYTNDLSTYIVFINSPLDINNSSFKCETEYLKNEIDLDLESARNANDGQLRTFRLALACTGEYAAFHGGTVPLVMAAMNTTMTRVNGVFERDVALTMVMVDNTSIIFLDGTTDPYTNNDGGTMLGENQTTCDTNIGSANYDIGHVFSTGGGGVAYLNSPCDSLKAGGVTGQGSPIGDTFDIDYVAHEMGHQYGANHTQNNNCQRSAVSVEPGSASTIMGYAGICPPNVQNNSDDYFHGENIKEMWANISTGASQCAAQSATGNSAPTAIAGADYSIPKSTPFVLKGDATDVDAGNSLTYCWEQVDTTPATMPPVSTSTVGPAFRSLQPKISPNRYMPNLATVIGGSTASTWEVVPSVGRTMNFSLTVRDNVSGGASSGSDSMIVTVNDTAGPFLVTSQATSGISWAENTTETITWDVAGTTANGVNTANVNILLSTDGGANFDTVLASNTPNDGSHDIMVPVTSSPNCRIMIEAIDNIFYAVNSNKFTIGNYITSCTQYASAANLNLAIPDNTGSPVSHIINIPDSKTIDFIKVNVDVSHTWINDLTIQIQHSNGTTFTNVWNRDCAGENDLDVIFEDGASAIVCAEPTIGTYSPNSPLNVFSGLDSAGDWTIAILDSANADTGVLNDWSIEICETTLSTPKFDELANLAIFPNPNNGKFTIKLNSNTGNDIKINVYDIRGRQVFNNSYNNNSNFNEVINLGNVQSGIYLLNISDGIRSTTKKIVVN
jgi:subtilisin-like proprotein convertase family protein